MTENKKDIIVEYVRGLTITEVIETFGSLKNLSKILGYTNDFNFYGSTDGGYPDYIFYEGIKQKVTKDFNFGEWTSVNGVVWDNNKKYPTNISNFSNMKYTSGNFGIFSIKLTNFGGLQTHQGNFSVGHKSAVDEWDTLKEVSGHLRIYESAVVKSLGRLKKVGGTLDIKGFVSDIGDLEFVGGDLIISNTTLKSLGNLKHVKGRLRIRNSSVLDIGLLEKVDGGVLIDKNTSPLLVKQLNERGIKYRK